MPSERLIIVPGTAPSPDGSCGPQGAKRSADSDSHPDPGPRILLIAQEGAPRGLYERAIRETGALVDTVASIGDFQGAVTNAAYNGIVVDIPTKIQALNRHKDLVNSILDRFPVIQVNQAKTTGRIRALLYGRHERQGQLQDLLREACLKGAPRRFRADKRCDIHFNLLLARAHAFDPGTIERTVTLNISLGGCFIITTARYQKGQRVWIRILELHDKTPIACEVIHKRKWGREMALPGIGVRFEALTASQEQALAQRCAPECRAKGSAGRP
jgi:hypothetical protein